MSSYTNPYPAGTPASTYYGTGAGDLASRNILSSHQKDPLGYTLRSLGVSGGNIQGTYGLPAEQAGLTNLYQMLVNQGRVDPRLLASAQAANARSTQQQQD